MIIKEKNFILNALACAFENRQIDIEIKELETSFNYLMTIKNCTSTDIIHIVVTHEDIIDMQNKINNILK